MTDKYIEIDEQNWKRAEHCRIFRNSLEPCYCVTLELDITRFLHKVKEKKLSFTLSMIFAVTKCANRIEEFRYRFINGKIVLYHKINTTFTYLNPETELFKVVPAEMTDSMDEYVRRAGEAAENQTEYFTGPLDNGIFLFSPLPWVSYTHISHTVSGKKDNAIPLFDWGKYFAREGKILLPFSVQVHHSFVDGIHVGKLVNGLQEYLNSSNL
ncbi:MAG: chloramphenicol acetyltransferase [Clostridiales bacterium 43-6]|nr:MAG: chloramphenicol acetyltransferase [Clostridiales bacterium 43-6]